MTCDPLHLVVLYCLWNEQILAEKGCGAWVLEDHGEMVAWKLQLRRDWVGRRSRSNLGRRGIDGHLLEERLREAHWRLFGDDGGYFRPCIRHLSLQRRKEISLTLPRELSVDGMRSRAGVMQGWNVKVQVHVLARRGWEARVQSYISTRSLCKKVVSHDPKSPHFNWYLRTQGIIAQ